MPHTPFIQSLQLRNFLSFGPEADEVELGPLNVLIGPNGAGKSNFLEAFALLRALPSNWMEPLQKGGGIRNFLWKGPGSTEEMALSASFHFRPSQAPLQYSLTMDASATDPRITAESLQNPTDTRQWDKDQGFLVRKTPGAALIARKQNDNVLRMQVLGATQGSVLGAVRSAADYPEITYVGEQLSQIQILRGWTFLPDRPPRAAQTPSVRGDKLADDASNLALVLSALELQPKVKRKIRDKLKDLYDHLVDYTTPAIQGYVQVYFEEEGLSEHISAARLSDGLLRYLCLLTLLYSPNPPPVVCLEEPEQGFHPDALPKVADLLREASERMQLIVTTHSDILVSALSDVPEAVLVCERGEDASTRIVRHSKDELKHWLEDYSLGDLWLRGELGGTKR